MRRLRIGTAAVALAALAACQARDDAGEETPANEVARQLAQLRIAPGLWEQSTTVLSVTAPGLPREVASQAGGPRPSRRYCITAEQAARPNASFLAIQQNSNCSYRDFTMEGGRISGTMRCTGGEVPGEIVTRMQGEYAPQRFDMRMEMQTQMADGETITTEVHVLGRRVGDCDAAAAR